MEIMTIEEVEELTRVSQATLRYWRHKGTGPRSFKIGRNLAWKRADVEAWIEEQYQAGRVAS